MKSRLKRVIKKVGSTSLVVAFYTPVILYVYSYVLIDCICNKDVKSSDK